jgi:hypothetical protein
LTSLALPTCFLRPESSYAWRATYFSSDARSSSPGAASKFETTDFPQELQQFDLSAYCSHDVIASYKDPHEDSFDGDADGQLLGPSLLGAELDDAEARALPLDGIVGVHRLGPYGGYNAIQLGPDVKGSMTIPVPSGRCRLVRVLLSGANGSSALAGSLVYENGEQQEFQIRCPDWYDDEFTQEGPPYSTPVLNNMDRWSQGKFDDANDPAIFEAVIESDPSTPIVGVRLSPAASMFPNDRSVANVLAITAVR